HFGVQVAAKVLVDREAKGRRLLLNHLLARDVRQMADVVLINPHPFFLNREKAPKREYFTADGYHIHRILGVRKMSKLIKVHVKKKLGAQWIGVRHCLKLPQIYSCSHCTLVQPLQDKRPQVVVVPELHLPPITMPASHRLPANDTILAVPNLPDRMTGEEGLEEVPAVGSWYICRTVVAYSPSVFLDLNSVRMALRFFLILKSRRSRDLTVTPTVTATPTQLGGRSSRQDEELSLIVLCLVIASALAIHLGHGGFGHGGFGRGFGGGFGRGFGGYGGGYQYGNVYGGFNRGFGSYGGGFYG
ncbi:hypothetical protein HPB47_013713, partial [Ixodes persulcatus]